MRRVLTVAVTVLLACGPDAPGVPEAPGQIAEMLVVPAAAVKPHKCKAPLADCHLGDKVNCDTNLSNDVQHCGSCTNSCTGSNANWACVNSVCTVSSCQSGFADCTAATGCETSISSDVNNCGTCGNACPAVAHANAACVGGSCTYSSCAAGYADCTTDPGCETSVLGDVNNCGACGNVCPPKTNADAACVGGSCTAVCQSGFGDCLLAEPGCETNVLTSVSNCGACGNACPAQPNAVVGCASGTCAVASCQSGFADCTTAAGCETNVLGDVNNCGSCGHACPAWANANVTCESGSCTASCVAPYADCTTAAGCETNVMTSTANCGSCGNACPVVANAATTCTAGTCGFTCNSGYHASGGACVADCGPCSPVAHGTTYCDGTTCAFTCNTGWHAEGPICVVDSPYAWSRISTKACPASLTFVEGMGWDNPSLACGQSTLGRVAVTWYGFPWPASTIEQSIGAGGWLSGWAESDGTTHTLGSGGWTTGTDLTYLSCTGTDYVYECACANGYHAESGACVANTRPYYAWSRVMVGVCGGATTTQPPDGPFTCNASNVGKDIQWYAYRPYANPQPPTNPTPKDDTMLNGWIFGQILDHATCVAAGVAPFNQSDIYRCILVPAEE